MQLASFNTKEEKDQFLLFSSLDNNVDAWVGLLDNEQGALNRNANRPLLEIYNRSLKISDVHKTAKKGFLCEAVVESGVLNDKNNELNKLNIQVDTLTLKILDLEKERSSSDITNETIIELTNENVKQKMKIDQNNKKIKELNEKISKYEKKTSVTLICDFNNINLVYSCSTEKFVINKENVEVEVSGEHLANKANEDVFELNISNSNTPFLTNNIFINFEKLRNIKIVKSQLQSLSNGVFTGADYLKKVFIEGNNIKSIKPNTFVGADYLNVLNLDNNQIESVTPGAFNGLKYLQILILSNNKLKEIPATLLDNMEELMYLKATANDFQRLDGALLNNNTKLREVWFDQNRIFNIGAKLLTYSNELERVVFSDNVCIDNDSENTCLDTVQNDIVQKCGTYTQQKGLNNTIWARCKLKSETVHDSSEEDYPESSE